MIEDVAILRLGKPVNPVSHQVLNSTEWAGRDYLVHGFTESETKGAWVEGKFKGETTGGWVQLMSADGSDLQIDQGFSGAGVWDLQNRKFAGIVVANKKRGGSFKHVSYMIPGSSISNLFKKITVNIFSFKKFVISCMIATLLLSAPIIGWYKWKQHHFANLLLTPYVIIDGLYLINDDNNTIILEIKIKNVGDAESTTPGIWINCDEGKDFSLPQDHNEPSVDEKKINSEPELINMMTFEGGAIKFIRLKTPVNLKPGQSSIVSTMFHSELRGIWEFYCFTSYKQQKEEGSSQTKRLNFNLGPKR